MPLVSKLSNKEIKRWELLTRVPKKPSKAREKNFCLTFSRASGSGGQLIAKRVAQKLGFKFYNKKIIKLISERSRIRKELIQSVDEASQNLVLGIVTNLVGASSVSGKTYIKHLCQVILTLAKKGKTVILGRGANFIVPKEAGLRVRIIAPLEFRTANTVKFEKMPLEKAQRSIGTIDGERKSFIKIYFGKEISNANYYDLVINRQYFEIDEAADIIVEIFKKKFG